MSKRLIFIISIIISSLISAQEFRNNNWGYGMDIVKNLETEFELTDSIKEYNIELLNYNGRIFGREVWLFYKFRNDSLIRAVYEFPPSSVLNDHFTFFQFLQTQLEVKYNEPKRIVWEWTDRDLKYTLDNNPEADDALLILFIQKYIKSIWLQWQTEDTDIFLELKPCFHNDGVVTPRLSIEYYSRKLDPETEQNDKDYINNNL